MTCRHKTVSATMSFFLAMALHPEVQARAQAEIDAVTHGTRMPELEDRERLPYIDAIVAEVFRWHGILPFGSTISLSTTIPAYLTLS